MSQREWPQLDQSMRSRLFDKIPMYQDSPQSTMLLRVFPLRPEATSALQMNAFGTVIDSYYFSSYCKMPRTSLEPSIASTIQNFWKPLTAFPVRGSTRRTLNRTYSTIISTYKGRLCIMAAKRLASCSAHTVLLKGRHCPTVT